MHAMDVRTLLLLLTALLLVSRSVLLAYVWHKVPDYQPVRWWAVGSVLIAAGVLLVGLRDVVPGFLSVLVGQGCIISGWAVTSSGTLKASGRETPWRFWWWLSLACMATGAWFFLGVTDYVWRTLAVGLPGMVFDAHVVWACFRYPHDNRRRGTLKVLGSVTLAAFLAALAKNIHVVHSQASSLLEPAWEVRLYLVITILTLTACTVLYVLLAAEYTQDALDLEIDQRERAAAKIFHQANHDRLTGLANRYAFFERLANELSRARRAGTHVGLLFMDLNRFKPVNDQYGHEAGDMVLKTVAERWTAMVRDTDTLARMGGDEFALLLGDLSSSEEACAVAQKMLRALDDWIELPDDKRCQVGTSIGIATYPENATEMDSLVAAADAAMYACKAKSDGGFAMSTAHSSAVTAGSDWVVFEDIHRVGVAEIDHQHRQLVCMVNNINRAVGRGSSDAELRKLFEELIQFAVQHFATEHGYMTAHAYPELANHDAQHEQLSRQLVEIFNRFEPGDEIRMLQTTKDWLMGHIMNADKQMGIFLQARGVS